MPKIMKKRAKGVSWKTVSALPTQFVRLATYLLGSDVVVVLDCIDQEHEQCTCYKFGEELARVAHEVGWIRAEDTSGRVLGVSWDCANTRTALELINGRLVVAIHNCGSRHRPKDLSEHVHWELLPLKLQSLLVEWGGKRRATILTPRKMQLAKVTAGLMWPPEIPELYTPSMTPIPQPLSSSVSLDTNTGHEVEERYPKILIDSCLWLLHRH